MTFVFVFCGLFRPQHCSTCIAASKIEQTRRKQQFDDDDDDSDDNSDNSNNTRHDRRWRADVKRSIAIGRRVHQGCRCAARDATSRRGSVPCRSRRHASCVSMRFLFWTYVSNLMVLCLLLLLLFLVRTRLMVLRFRYRLR